jgi:hypothetical protein
MRLKDSGDSQTYWALRSADSHTRTAATLGAGGGVASRDSE